MFSAVPAFLCEIVNKDVFSASDQGPVTAFAGICLSGSSVNLVEPLFVEGEIMANWVLYVVLDTGFQQHNVYILYLPSAIANGKRGIVLWNPCVNVI